MGIGHNVQANQVRRTPDVQLTHSLSRSLCEVVQKLRGRRVAMIAHVAGNLQIKPRSRWSCAEPELGESAFSRLPQNARNPLYHGRLHP